MAEIELTRVKGDRLLYELAGVGTVRLSGWTSRIAQAEAGGRSWQLQRRGVFGTTVEATDAAGTAVGHFKGRGILGGGALRWHEREFALRPASQWRERCVLADGERELALIEGKGWGRRPVKVVLDDPAALDPGLLLFAAFVVRGLAEEAGTGGTAGLGD